MKPIKISLASLLVILIVLRSINERMPCTRMNQDHFHFNQWTKDTNILEVPLINAKFTWIGPSNRKSTLDRAFINLEWAKVGVWELKATVNKNSNHRGIVFSDGNMNWGPKPFRVFNTWLKEEGLLKLIEDKSKGGNSKGNIQVTLKKIKSLIKEWNLGSNGNIHLRIDKLEADLA